jgi:hypothetical protein
MRCCKLPERPHHRTPGEDDEPRNKNNVLHGNQPPPPSTKAERKLQQMVLDLGAKYDLLSKTVVENQSEKEPLANLFQNTDSMFTDEVANTAFPEKSKVHYIPIFTGSEDPMEHLMTFRSHTSLRKTPNAVACRAFPLTLSGKARNWLKNLLHRSIDNFDILGQKFLTQFMSGRVRRKPRGYLLSMRQGPNESLRDYLWRFNQEKLDTESAPDDFIYSAIFQGLRKDGPLTAELALKPPKNLHAFMIKVDRYINQKETLRAFLGPPERQSEPSPSEKSSKKKKPEAVQDHNPSDYKKVRKNFWDYKWTPLYTTHTEVMMAIEKDPAFQRPKPLPGVPPARLADKYCAFHNCHGHLTEQCISLRQLIKKFIKNGKLVRFLVSEKNHQDRARALRPREKEERQHRRDYASRREERQERAKEPTPRPREEERRERSRSRARENDNLPIIHTISRGFGGGESLVRPGRLMQDSWMTLRCIWCRSLLRLEGVIL